MTEYSSGDYNVQYSNQSTAENPTTNLVPETKYIILNQSNLSITASISNDIISTYKIPESRMIVSLGSSNIKRKILVVPRMMIIRKKMV